MLLPAAGFLTRAGLVLALTCSAGFGGVALAMWAMMSDAELLLQSDLIVIGTWQGTTAAPAAATPTPTPGTVAPSVGAVAVNEVLKGPSATTRVLLVIPAAGALRSSSDIHFSMGDHGLWLLRKQPGGAAGLYLADHPQRFVSTATGAERIEILRKLLRLR